MIVSKMLRPPGIWNKADEEITDFALNALNELQRESIVQIVASCTMQGIASYFVFYEKENICTCPGCGHDLSKTFSFCPNCGRKLK